MLFHDYVILMLPPIGYWSHKIFPLWVGSTIGLRILWKNFTKLQNSMIVVCSHSQPVGHDPFGFTGIT